LTEHSDNKLQKGSAFHYNFLLLGFFNMLLPLMGCPYITGSIPHSPQFVRALAKTEVVRDGAQEKTRIVQVFENRLAPFLVNVLILICLPLIWELRIMPTSVISDALFLFMGATGLPGNDLWERFKLMFTESSLYPPLHFSQEEVPRSRMHIFTIVQVLCVAVLYAVSRSAIAVAFPIFLVLTVPVKFLIPRLTCGLVTVDMVAILDNEQQPKVSDIEEGASIEQSFDKAEMPQKPNLDEGVDDSSLTDSTVHVTDGNNSTRGSTIGEHDLEVEAANATNTSCHGDSYDVSI
jgi:hypothetical protein